MFFCLTWKPWNKKQTYLQIFFFSNLAAGKLALRLYVCIALHPLLFPLEIWATIGVDIGFVPRAHSDTEMVTKSTWWNLWTFRLSRVLLLVVESFYFHRTHIHTIMPCPTSRTTSLPQVNNKSMRDFSSLYTFVYDGRIVKYGTQLLRINWCLIIIRRQL